MTREEFFKQRRQVRLLSQSLGKQFSYSVLVSNGLSLDVYLSTLTGFSLLSVSRAEVNCTGSRVGRGPLGMLP